MSERRFSARRLIHLNVTLYNDEIGQISGKIQDVSSGGMYVNIFNSSSLNRKLSDTTIFVRPDNMDIIFNMKCLRVEKNFIGLEFIE